MSEKLKFSVTYSKTLNLGNYESEKFTLSQEFHLGDVPIQKAMKLVKAAVEEMIYGVPSDNL